jgi:hypothetical protein
MSNYHALFQNIDRKNLQVVFHVPIPSAGLNAAGIGWRAAVLLERGLSGQLGKSALPNILPAELAALDNGSLIEAIENVQFSSISLTDAQRNGQVLAAYNAAASSLLAQKQITLNFMGYNSSP